MKRLLFLFIILPAISQAQLDSVASRSYQWINPANTTVLFEGSTYDFEWMQMSSRRITVDKKTLKAEVPKNEEQLLIVKSGIVHFRFHDSSFSLGAGSIALLLPGEKYELINAGPSDVDYYLMKYRSKKPSDIERGKSAGGSFVKEWSKITFNPHDRGGVRNYFNRATAMSSRFEMHVTTLNAGLKSHEPHTHRASEIVLMIEGDTEMQIGQSFYKGTSGDFYFLGTNVLHGVRNIGTKPCMYFAFQFE